MKINKKHVISLVLALAMVLSCMPGIALVTNAATQYDQLKGRSIVVDYDGYMAGEGKDWAEELLATLPTTATIGGEGEYAITWPTAEKIKTIVDPDAVDYYFIPGTVEGVANAVTVTVQVRNEANLINNGDFENGTTGWTAASWGSPSVIADPLNTENQVAKVKRSGTTTGAQALYQSGAWAADTEQTALADRVKSEGHGQYCLKADGLSVAYSSSYTANKDTELLLQVYTKKTETSSSASLFTTAYVTLSTEEWTTVKHVFDIEADYFAMRTDMKLKASSTYPAACLDNIKLIPLNVALANEPATITGITTEDPVALGVVQNYDTYVSADWQTELGLLSEVTVTTSDTENPTATATVEWDYSALKLDTVGRYVLTGELVPDAYTNPDGLTVKQVIYVREKTNLVYNGNFADREGVDSAYTVPGWAHDSWTKYVVKNPDNEDDYILRLSRATAKTTTMSPIKADTTGEAALNTGIKQYGAGQYYMQFDAKSVAFSSEYTAREDVLLWLRIQKTSGTTTTTITYTSDTAKMSTEWTTYGKQFNIDDLNVTFNLNMRVKNPTANSAVYVDNIEVFPLRVELAETPALPIKYASVDLSNSLDMNFYIDEAVLADVASAKIVHTYADGTTDEQVKALSDISVDGEGESYITYNDIAAKEMGDSITVTLYNGEGAAIAVWMDSMVDYLARISDQIPEDLYTDLLNYGAAAQKYFGYNTTQLVNSDVTTSIRDITPTNNSNGSDAWTGSTLTLESNILMEVFFAKDELTDTETATVTYTTHAGTSVSKEVSLVLDDYYDEWKVQIDGLAIADVSTVVTVTVGELTVTDSMESYVARQLGKGETDDIYKAILAVGDSAKTYFASL